MIRVLCNTEETLHAYHNYSWIVMNLSNNTRMLNFSISERGMSIYDMGNVVSRPQLTWNMNDIFNVSKTALLRQYIYVAYHLSKQ